MSSRTLTRQLTLPAATALVVSQVIAVGIFLTPGTIIGAMASPLGVLIVWGLIGAMTLCGALCYGALAGKYPHAGGGYVYLREVYGPKVAFLYGWKCFLIMDPGITAALAAGLASYVGFIVPLGPFAARAVPIVTILALALVHIVGVKPGTRLVTTLATLKIALIVGLIGIALLSPAGDWHHFLPFAARHPGAPPLAAATAGALIAAFFTFGGWWEVAKISGEVQDPARTLPRAFRIGLTAVTLIYVMTTLAFIYVIPIERVGSGQAFVAEVGSVLLGPTGGISIAAVVVVCVLGSLGVMLMIAPRLYFAMATDGLFPSAAAAVHPRFGTPARAIAVQALLACLIVAVGTFDTIVAYFIFITVVFIGLTVGAVFVLARRDPAFHVPGHPWTALVFLGMVAGLLALLAVNNPLQAALGVAIVALGLPVYRLARPARPASAAHPSEAQP